MSYFIDYFDNDTLNKAYEALARVTPLSFDCGTLCAGKCCSGGEKDGMLLYPGEKAFFEHKPGFTVYYDDKYSAYAVSCGGVCDRCERPLACRIFPYMFYAVERDGKRSVTVAPDMRAVGVCPIPDLPGGADRQFLRQMRIIAERIEADDELFAFSLRLTDLLTDLGGF